jgi:hypothetical protein
MSATQGTVRYLRCSIRRVEWSAVRLWAYQPSCHPPSRNKTSEDIVPNQHVLSGRLSIRASFLARQQPHARSSRDDPDALRASARASISDQRGLNQQHTADRLYPAHRIHSSTPPGTCLFPPSPPSTAMPNRHTAGVPPFSPPFMNPAQQFRATRGAVVVHAASSRHGFHPLAQPQGGCVWECSPT